MGLATTRADAAVVDFAEACGPVGPVAVRGGGTHWEVGGLSAPETRILRAPSGIVVFEPAEMTVRVLAGTPVAALAAERARVEDRLLADLQPAAGRGLGDDAGRFDTLHQRQSMCDSGSVVAHVQVDAVEPDCVHAQQRFTRGRHGPGEVSQPKAFAAPLFQNGSFHG